MLWVLHTWACTGLIQSHRFALYAVVYDVQLRSENVTPQSEARNVFG